MLQSEREFETTIAIELALSFASQNNLELETVAVGSSLKTVRCRLTGKEGGIFFGFGKGLGAQSEASAIFEAFEHFFYQREDLNKHRNFLEFCPGQYDSTFLDACPDLPRILNGVQPVFRRIEFQSLSGSSSLHFPAFLTSPFYKSDFSDEADFLFAKRLMRYSSNSGTSSGLSKCEAVLHGLLELVERDSIGIELLRTVVSNHPEPVRNILRSSLPNPLQELIELIEIEVDCSIQIFDATSDIGIPTTIAKLQSNETAAIYFGSGASISFAHSIERAVLEAMQGFHINVKFGIPIKQLSKKPVTKLHKCMMEAGVFDFQGGECDVEYDSGPCGGPLDESLCLSSQIDCIVSRLSSLGYDPFWRSIFEGDIFVTQVVVPQLERFFLVSAGIPVAPGRRGRKWLHGDGPRLT